MWKNTLISIVSLSLFFSGCSKQPEANNALNDLPQWYQNPTVLGDVYASAGSAKPNRAQDRELQKIEATAIARAELARSLELRVKDMFKRATQELGTGDDQKLDHAMQYVTKQVSDVTLEGSYQKKLYVDPDTEILYALVVIDESRLKQTLKQNIATSLHDEEALWQKFQATQMWQELDDETGKK